MGEVRAKQEENQLRAAILTAARSLLVRHGLRDFSLRSVARAVGRSATAIYLHFEGKDGLVHALMDEGFNELRGELAEANCADQEPRERLLALSRVYVDFALRSPELYEIMFVLRTETLERYPRESYREARQGLEPFIAALDELASFRRVEGPDTGLAAAALWSTLHGAVSLVHSKRLDGQLDERSFLESAVQLAVSSVAPIRRSK